MKKHYTKIMRSLMYGGALSALVLFVMGTAEMISKHFIISAVSYGMGVLVLGYFVFIRINRIKGVQEYLNIIALQNSSTSTDAIRSLPIPMMISQIDGSIMWYNDMFAQAFCQKSLFDVPIQEVITELKWSDVLKSTDRIELNVHYQGHHYQVVGNIVSAAQSEDEEKVYTVILYFIDMTEKEQIETRYTAEKTDIAIISIDNYDEILQKMDDSERQQTIAQIDKHINEWVSQSGGVLKKTERDRYIMLFEDQYLKTYIDKKFDVLDAVRSVGEGAKMPITISIGIGVGGHLAENESYARAAIDMVFGRGGDQAAIKDETQYKFYGGKTKEYEKSTRVKTRAFSVALKDFMLHADQVILMGHHNADYDSFGAAMGLQRAARSLGKKPYIVLDESPAVQNIVREVREKEEYDGMLIDTDAALEIVTEDTLVIVLDTHRPSMLPCPQLLTMASKVVLIDHHRRSTEFIQNCSLVYHEPYASSTCEMVTEILQYLDDGRKMTTFEAKALYVGLVMDTKNFVVKTGVRTFEAASSLRRYGVDTTMVKKLFAVKKEDYEHRASIVEKTEIFRDGIAAASCTEDIPNVKVISSQAADEMLNLDGVRAAFVLYRHDGGIGISGRSLGEVNVQIILEKLGGGGHMTVAGAQIKGAAIEEVNDMLKKAITEYIAENTK